METPQSVLRTASSAQGTPYGCPFRGALLGSDVPFEKGELYSVLKSPLKRGMPGGQGDFSNLPEAEPALILLPVYTQTAKTVPVLSYPFRCRKHTGQCSFR